MHRFQFFLHGFRLAFRPGTKIKQIKSKNQEPLGKKKCNVLYNIPCGCQKASYTGETWRACNVRKKEHQNKVRLTKEDIKNGQITSAEKRISSEDGGLAKHSTQCTNDIDWAAFRILATETGLY